MNVRIDTKDQARHSLRERILRTDLPPGSVLDEAAICAETGLSRTPIREVFQRLAGEGFLVLVPNRAPAVAPLDLGRLRQFFRTAPLIYATIARLAAENGTRAQLEALKEIQRGFARATAGEAPDAALWNHRFHAQIGAMADDPYLAPALDRMLIDHTRLGQTFYRPASIAESVLVKRATGQHDAMIAAFEMKNAEQAVELTMDHWDLSRDRIARFVHPEPLPLDPSCTGDGE